MDKMVFREHRLWAILAKRSAGGRGGALPAGAEPVPPKTRSNGHAAMRWQPEQAAQSA